MIRLDDFVLEASLSREYYNNKEEQTAAIVSKERAKELGLSGKMCFSRRQLTVKMLFDEITSGKSLCHLFSNHPVGVSMKTYTLRSGEMTLSGKADEFFFGSWLVGVDIDQTGYSSISDYLCRLEKKPTFAYPTFSNGGEKGVRFRMIYVFSHLTLGITEYKKLAAGLNNYLEEATGEIIADKCNLRPSQYFNGVTREVQSNPDDYLFTGIIYTPSEFPGKTDIEEVDLAKQEDLEESGLAENPVSPELMSDMNRLEYDEFMRYNRHKYSYFYRSEKPEWKHGIYQDTDENYISLFWNRTRQEDGQKRRKKLFSRMCLRRLIRPEVDADTLMFCAYEDRYRFFDNTDGVLSIECLAKNVAEAMKLELSEISEMYSNKLQYMKENRPKRIFKLGVFSRNNSEDMKERKKIISKLIKEDNREIIGEYYDVNLSTAENQKVLEEIGIKFSVRTLERFCRESGIVPVKSKKIDSRPELLKIFKECYEPSLSIRKNLDHLKWLDPRFSFRIVRDFVQEVG